MEFYSEYIETLSESSNKVVEATQEEFESNTSLTAIVSFDGSRFKDDKDGLRMLFIQSKSRDLSPKILNSFGMMEYRGSLGACVGFIGDMMRSFPDLVMTIKTTGK